MDQPLAHAITDIEGRFLNVDGQFRALIRRELREIIGRTILEVTGEAFRQFNADKLSELRESGKPFVIRKTYLCGDGTTQAVENSVSLLNDGSNRPMLAASVRALPTDPGPRFAASVGVARALLDEHRARAALGPMFEDRDWRLLLAAYVAEADGLAVASGAVRAAAGGDAQADLLRIWELVNEGALVVEGRPASLGDANLRVSSDHAAIIERHLRAVVDGRKPG